MPLPIAGGPPKPSRPPTHQPMDLRRLMQIAPELEEELNMAGHERLTPEIVAELASDIGASEAQICAAAAMMTDLAWDETESPRVEICIGGCQSWGAAPVLEKLLTLRAQRREAGEPSFGVVPKRCLDKCDRAAVVLIKTPDGTAGISEATVENVEEAVRGLS